MNPVVQLSELSKTLRQPTAGGGSLVVVPAYINRQDNQPTSRTGVFK